MRAVNITEQGPSRSIETIALTKREKEALRAFVARVRQSLGENLVKVILFGSKARGQAKRGSDIDLLVIVQNRDMPTEKKVIEQVVETELHYKIYRFSPIIYSVEDYEDRKKMEVPFTSEIETDGVMLE